MKIPCVGGGGSMSIIATQTALEEIKKVLSSREKNEKNAVRIYIKNFG
jgi:Fe-S cluster assembly iron-binding protein IscA